MYLDVMRDKDPTVSSYYHNLGDQALPNLGKLAIALADIVKMANTTPASVGIDEAFKDSLWQTVDRATKEVFGYAMTTVVISGYFASVKEARSGTYVPFVLGGPEMILGCFADSQ